MLEVTLRRGDGAIIGYAPGRNWQRTAERIYNETLCPRPRRHMATDQWFPTDDGAPYGTHHVQMGYRLRDGSTTLDDLIVVHVERG